MIIISIFKKKRDQIRLKVQIIFKNRFHILHNVTKHLLTNITKATHTVIWVTNYRHRGPQGRSWY